jgi:hypothetical protein
MIEPEGSPSHEEILRDYLLVSAQGLLIINSESQTAPFIFTFQANTGASTLVGPIVALGGLQRYFLGAGCRQCNGFEIEGSLSCERARTEIELAGMIKHTSQKGREGWSVLLGKLDKVACTLNSVVCRCLVLLSVTPASSLTLRPRAFAKTFAIIPRIE